MFVRLETSSTASARQIERSQIANAAIPHVGLLAHGVQAARRENLVPYAVYG